MELAELARYGLYAITVALGIALVAWLLRSRQLRQTKEAQLRKARTARQQTSPAPRIRSPHHVSMAQAIAGIRLPTEWQADPAVEAASPMTLTTAEHTAAEMASKLSDELVRLGYSVSPTGARSAKAVRNSDCIMIEVGAADNGAPVSTRLSLAAVERG